MKGTVVPPSRDAHSRPPLLTSLPTACQNRSALLQQSRVPTTAPDVTSRFISLAWTQNRSDRQQTSEIDKEPRSIFDPITRDGGVSAVSCNITDNKRFWHGGKARAAEGLFSSSWLVSRSPCALTCAREGFLFPPSVNILFCLVWIAGHKDRVCLK